MSDRLHIRLTRLFLLGLVSFAISYPCKFIIHTANFAFSRRKFWQMLGGLDNTVMVGLARENREFV